MAGLAALGEETMADVSHIIAVDPVQNVVRETIQEEVRDEIRQCVGKELEQLKHKIKRKIKRLVRQEVMTSGLAAMREHLKKEKSAFKKAMREKSKRLDAMARDFEE